MRAFDLHHSVKMDGNEEQRQMEKRQTRRRRADGLVSATKDGKADDPLPINEISKEDEQLYLIEPTKREVAPISETTLNKVAEKLKRRCQKLIRRTERAIETELDNILYEQAQKNEMKFNLLQ